MYKKIMVPVDLGHTEALGKALATAADLSRVYSAPVQMVAVTPTAPTAVAHNPEEFARKLADYAAAESARYGVAFAADALTSPEPAADLDETLGREARAIGADLIVMASHVPGLAEHLRASRAGYLASHSDVSVFVVR